MSTDSKTARSRRDRQFEQLQEHQGQGWTPHVPMPHSYLPDRDPLEGARRFLSRASHVSFTRASLCCLRTRDGRRTRELGSSMRLPMDPAWITGRPSSTSTSIKSPMVRPMRKDTTSRVLSFSGRCAETGYGLCMRAMSPRCVLLRPSIPMFTSSSHTVGLNLSICQTHTRPPNSSVHTAR